MRGSLPAIWPVQPSRFIVPMINIAFGPKSGEFRRVPAAHRHKRPFSLIAAVLGMILCLGATLPLRAEVVERGGFQFEYLPEPGWVELLALADEWPADAPGAESTDWRGWSSDWQTNHRGAEPERYVESAFEPLSQQLVAEAARFRIDFLPEYQRLRIHRVELRRQGVWLDRYNPERITLARRESGFESDVATGAVTALILVDDVRPGDVLRYRYSIVGTNPILAGITHGEFPLAWTSPILQLRIRLLYPAGTRLHTLRRAGAAEPSIQSGADGVVLSLHQERIAEVQLEDSTPPGHDLLPVLEVAPERDWAKVVAWALPLYPMDLALPDELEQRVQTWQQLQDPEAQVLAALGSVQDEVRYFSAALGESTHRPAPPRSTWERRFGDCKDKALLLSRLLRALGFDAVPALVSTERGDAMARALPSAGQFDHVIVRLRWNGETWWLDPTLSQQRGPLRMRLAPNFRWALPIAAGVEALEALGDGAGTLSSNSVVERYQIAEERALLLSIEYRLGGPIAEAHRRDLHSRSLAAIQRDYADHYRRLHGDLEVVEDLRYSDDANSGVLTMNVQYRLTKPWQSDAASEYRFQAYADAIAGLIRLEGNLDRKHPLQRPHRVLSDQRIEFAVPENWTSGVAADEFERADSSFRYHRRVRTDASVVQVEQRFESRTDLVPLEDLVQHFAARREAIERLHLNISLRAPAADAAKERDQRIRNLLREVMHDEKKRGKR